mmetsp:Transcript_70662/g.63462  ORF Transcript_70662/g.63462 Transcript_70662/m.63462 type:complete len:273 (-) Transcript_70662:181-999(-)
MSEEKAAEAIRIYKSKQEAIDKAFAGQQAKVADMFRKQIILAQRKYVAFTVAVEADVEKRLKIVDKVIDAESEERKWKIDQEQQKKEREASEAAEAKLREEAEARRRAEEEKARKAELKKKEKARKKMLKERAKVPIPPGYVDVKNSAKLASKLKKLKGKGGSGPVGRFAMCCFSLKKDKAFRAYCEEMSAEYNENVAWFNCEIKDDNFEAAMLLYEFNDTPAVIVTQDGEVDKYAQFLLGWYKGDEKQKTMKEQIAYHAKRGNEFGLQAVE